jgi:site-specific DNA-methyltransferase (adenine-specific)
MYRLEHSSCFPFLEKLEDNSIELILTDPPYLISRDTGFSNGTNPDYDRLKISMQFGTWDQRFDGFPDVVKQFERVLKPSGTCIIFYDLWKISELAGWLKTAGLKQLRFMEWLKTNPVPINQSVNYLTNGREAAVSAVKGGKPTFHSKYDNGVYEFPIEHSKGRFHPTQKSLKLIEALVAKHSNLGDLVLDPFAGSGTTGVAAVTQGRRFIGCEIDQTYCERALLRLKDSINGP